MQALLLSHSQLSLIFLRFSSDQNVSPGLLDGAENVPILGEGFPFYLYLSSPLFSCLLPSLLLFLSCFLKDALYVKEKHLSRYFWSNILFLLSCKSRLWPRQLGYLMCLFIKLPQDTQSLGKLPISHSYKRSIQISKFSIFSDYIGSRNSWGRVCGPFGWRKEDRDKKYFTDNNVKVIRILHVL